MFRALFSILILFAIVLGIFYLYEGNPLPFVGGTLEDAKSVASVKAAFALHRDLSQRPISVSADGTKLTLSGKVANNSEKREATELAAAVQGVEEVTNLLRVEPELASDEADPDRSLGQKLDDAALTAKVKGAFALNKELNDLDLAIRVRTGTVLLEGEVETPEQAEAAQRWAKSVAGVENVENHLRVAGAEESIRELRARIESSLAHNENLQSYELTTSLRGGTIVLKGQVRTGAERELAGLLAEGIAGKRLIRNEIRLSP